MSTVLALVGARGGVGRSEIASVFARAVAQTGTSVAVIDAHEGEGPVGMLLGIDPHDTHERLPAWAAAVADGPIGNEGLLHSMVATSPDGVGLVRGAFGFGWTLEHPAWMDNIIQSVQAVYAVVVIVCPPMATAATLGALRTAGIIVLVTDPSTAGLHQTAQFLALLQEEKRPPAGVLITCPHAEVVPDRGVVAELLGCSVLGVVPFDRTLAIAAPPRALDGPFARSVRVALDPMVPGIAPATPRAWWRRRSRGRGA